MFFTGRLNGGVSDSGRIPKKISDFYFSFIDMNQLSQLNRQNKTGISLGSHMPYHDQSMSELAKLVLLKIGSHMNFMTNCQVLVLG